RRPARRGAGGLLRRPAPRRRARAPGGLPAADLLPLVLEGMGPGGPARRLRAGRPGLGAVARAARARARRQRARAVRRARGDALDDERFLALIRPGDGVDTVLTADTYGQGEADSLLGRALQGLDRASFSLVGAVGHDFYDGERQGAKGFPRFTDPALRGPHAYAGYLR